MSLPSRAVVCGHVFDLESLGREPSESERRFIELLSLAGDDASTWHGVTDERVTGNWPLLTNAEMRRIRQREQEAMFGRVVVPYDPDHKEHDGDELNFTLPPDTKPRVANRSGTGCTEYFWFKCHKNGNLHLEFKRLDLLAHFNKIAGRNRLPSPAEYE